MTNIKVVLPKEVAEAIDNLRKQGITDYGIVVGTAEGYLGRNRVVVKEYFREGTRANADLLMQALVNGYEVERTPHDELRDLYYEMSVAADSGSRYSHIGRRTVEKTLNILGITVEGINDTKTKGCE